MSTWPGSVTARLVLAMTLVAAVATGATGLLAAPLLHGATEDAARGPLARQAELLAQLPNTELLVRRVERRTDVQDLTLGIVTRTGVRRGAALALSAGQMNALLAGDSVSGSATLDDVPVLVEARPTQRGGAVVLAASSDSIDAAAAALRQRILVALAWDWCSHWPPPWPSAPGWPVPWPAPRTSPAGWPPASVVWSCLWPGGNEVGDVVHALGSLDQALRASESRQREFLLSVSHELRTPLTAVRGLAEGLADGTIDPGESPSVGQTIVTESQRLEGYIADLLTLARFEAEDFTLERTRWISPPWSVMPAGCGPSAPGRPGSTYASRGPGTLWVESDPARVRQVLDALADNAVRVCPPGSVLVLAAGADTGAPTIQVRDSGPGLTEDDLAHAFEPGVLHGRYAGSRAGGHGSGWRWWTVSSAGSAARSVQLPRPRAEWLSWSGCRGVQVSPGGLAASMGEATPHNDRGRWTTPPALSDRVRRPGSAVPRSEVSSSLLSGPRVRFDAQESGRRVGQ